MNTISTEILHDCQLLIILADPTNVAAALAAAHSFTGIDIEVLAQEFKAEPKQISTFNTQKPTGFARLALVAIATNAQPHTVQQTLRSLLHKQRKQLQNTNINVYIRHFEADAQAQLGAAITQATELAYYNIAKYTSNIDGTPPILFNGNLHIICADAQAEKLQIAATQARHLAEVQQQVMDLVNAPANHLTPEIFAKIAQKTGKEYDFDVKVWDETLIKQHNFGALLAVNQGSAQPARFVMMHHTHPAATQTIAIVGKGVTFDTGGVSIKASANMHYMKSDMAGAAAAFGAVAMAARLHLPINIIAAMPLTDNAVDSQSVQPGDVVTSHSGQTIEIIDTDAEGRLILADALSYITQAYTPDTIIDLATLTGACIVALGGAAAGLFCNNETLTQKLYAAGQTTGEKLWAMPLWDDYEIELKSDVADVKNYHGKPSAGSIVAAKFLEKFIHKHPKWAHIDIAGTAFAPNEYGTMANATAFGVALLTEFMQKEA